MDRCQLDHVGLESRELEDDHLCSVSFEGNYRGLFEGTVATSDWRDDEGEEIIAICQF
jgi:hypothetical protein